MFGTVRETRRTKKKAPTVPQGGKKKPAGSKNSPDEAVGAHEEGEETKKRRGVRSGKDNYH